jgi:hypothetical protein
MLNRSSCLAATSGVTKYIKINSYLFGHTMSYLSLSDLDVKLTQVRGQSWVCRTFKTDSTSTTKCDQNL